jgi:hypothetical protein
LPEARCAAGCRPTGGCSRLGVRRCSAAPPCWSWPSVPGHRSCGAFPGWSLPGWGVLFVRLVFVVVNGLGEETGWRGYALPLPRRRHGTLAASLLIVPIWAGWHLPLLFLLQSYCDQPWPRWCASHLACSPLVELSAWCLQRRDHARRPGRARSRSGFVDSFELLVAPGSSAARLAARNVPGADARPRVPDGFCSSKLGP